MNYATTKLVGEYIWSVIMQSIGFYTAVAYAILSFCQLSGNEFIDIVGFLFIYLFKNFFPDYDLWEIQLCNNCFWLSGTIY